VTRKPQNYALHEVWLQTPHQLQPDREGIRSNLATTLEDSDCSNFIKDILSRAASANNPLVEGGDLLKIFDRPLFGPISFGAVIVVNFVYGLLIRTLQPKTQ
jgi:hypothetical protein